MNKKENPKFNIGDWIIETDEYIQKAKNSIFGFSVKAFPQRVIKNKFDNLTTPAITRVLFDMETIKKDKKSHIKSENFRLATENEIKTAQIKMIFSKK